MGVPTAIQALIWHRKKRDTPTKAAAVPIGQIEKAAQAATAAANDYCQAARRATWQAAGTALLVNVVLVVGLVAFLVQWIPPLQGDPGTARRARRARRWRGGPGKSRRQGQAHDVRRAGAAVHPDG